MLIAEASKNFSYRMIKFVFLYHVKTQHLTCTRHESIGGDGPDSMDPSVNTPLNLSVLK